jgi:hemoglobin/transferrin/lactoferrin receptor protein
MIFNKNNKRQISLKPLAAAVALAITSPLVFADQSIEVQDAENKEIETIVVVGETTNTVITPTELDKYQANDLADIFRLVPSVSVGGSLGLVQKIYIRGMEDTLLNVTVDGAPQTGTLFHHIGRVSIEPELLQEVEVQSGAGEATSGSGAIGGAIRFKTKSVDDLLADDEKFGGLLKASYFSNNGYKVSGTFYGTLNDDWGLLGSYTHVDRENMEDGDGNELYGTAAEQSLAFFKLNGQLTDNQKITLSYESRNEEGEFSKQPNWTTYADSVLYPLEAERETIIFNHSFHANDLINLETTLYNTTSSVQRDLWDSWGLYSGEMNSQGFDVRNTSLVDAHTLTYGIEYRNDEVNGGIPGEAGAKEKGTVAGVYFQDHWKILDSVLLSYGMRYDSYDVDQVTYDNEISSDGFSPNVGVLYTVNDNWKLNVGYAQAMRGKEVGDSFTLEQWGAGWVSIDPNLEAEKVENTEVGLTYHNSNLQITATLYQSSIDNVILDQLGGSPAYYFENVGTLDTDGFELKASYWWESLQVVASYSNNDATLDGMDVEGYEHIGLANERGDSYGLNLTYSLSDDIELGWNFTYVDDLNDIEVLHRAVEINWIDRTYEIDKPSYSVHDIYVQWQPLNNDDLSVNLAVQNLFNEHYRDHSSVGDYSTVPGWGNVSGIYESGRDIRVSLNYQF